MDAKKYAGMKAELTSLANSLGNYPTLIEDHREKQKEYMGKAQSAGTVADQFYFTAIAQNHRYAADNLAKTRKRIFDKMRKMRNQITGQDIADLNLPLEIQQ